MKKIKRFTAGILAMAAALSAVGCGDKSNNNGTFEAEKAADVIKNSYSAVEVGVFPPCDYLSSIYAVGDTGKYFIHGSNGEGFALYLTDSDFMDYEEIDIFGGEKHYEMNAIPAVMRNGDIYVYVTFADYPEGTEQPDYNDPDFDWEKFDWEAYYAAATYSQKFIKLDSDGKVEKEMDLSGIDKLVTPDEESGIYINNFLPLGNDMLLCSVGSMDEEVHVLVGTDGKAVGKVDIGDNVYIGRDGAYDKDGNILFTDYDEKAGASVIKKIDASTLTVSEDVISLKDVNNVRQLSAGNEEYPILAVGETSLFGIKEDNTIEEIINWVDSDLSPDDIMKVFPVENGEYIVFIYSWGTDSKGIYRLTKRDASEFANAVIINMAAEYMDAEIMSLVNEYNRSHSDYRIRVEDYSKYYEWSEEKEQQTNSPSKQILSDIAAGKKFDIIYSGDDSMFMNLGKKGALVDLYTLMGKNGSPSKDDFVPSALTSCETDGKLCSIPTGFSVETFVIKKKFYDKDSWTFDDLLQVYENRPEGCKLFDYENTKERVFEAFVLNTSEFVDLEKGTCNFDSPEFIKLLEFVDTFDNAGEGEEIDWDNMTDDEINSYFDEQEMAFRRDKALIDKIWLSDPKNYKMTRDGSFGEDISLVGSPSSSGSGATIETYSKLAILSSSPSADACWEFICRFFTEESQEGEFAYDLPVIRTSFDKVIDASMEKSYWTDENGNKNEYDETYYMGGQTYVIEPLTQEERDYVADYILNAKPGKILYGTDIYDIINEEVKPFFAGEKTAQETAELIQNRVSIAVSEQY